MNGHVSFSISMKNVQEIKDAISLLTSILPIEEKKDPTEHSLIPHEQYENWVKEKTPYAIAEGDIVKLLTKNSYPKPKGPDRKQIDTDIKKRKLKQKFRRNASKRKRDTHGHFLKEDKK
jgi:hypothetical protein